ncbi:MAG: hypothetical protein EAX96_07485 [Candidatus Lokiarchaeota archaeon]|nr:hypothetical protein [Candidatus Lokiarchaeota archaeon]
MNSKYIVLLDNDKEVKSKGTKYEKKPKSHPETINHLILLDENKTIEDYIPIKILIEALNNYGNSDLSKVFEDSSKYPNWNEYDFNYPVIPKFKEIVDSINQPEDGEKINLGEFKLGMMLAVKKLINSKNIDQFTELINKIQLIEKTARQIYGNVI